MLKTLPDYLRPGLDIVFVGLNPSIISVKQGHYFANPRNRFWKALNMSGLIPVELNPELDSHMIDYGIGLTDLIKKYDIITMFDVLEHLSDPRKIIIYAKKLLKKNRSGKNCFSK